VFKRSAYIKGKFFVNVEKSWIRDYFYP